MTLTLAIAGGLVTCVHDRLLLDERLSRLTPGTPEHTEALNARDRCTRNVYLMWLYAAGQPGMPDWAMLSAVR